MRSLIDASQTLGQRVPLRWVNTRLRVVIRELAP